MLRAHGCSTLVLAEGCCSDLSLPDAADTEGGPETKGGSYFRVADALDLWDGRDVFASDGNDAGADCRAAVANSTVRVHAVSEEYATNSLENLMFLVCRFREVTGRYPERVSVVSMGGSS